MSRRSLVVGSSLVLAWLACACLGRSDAGEAAKEPAIKKGDKVRVVNGPAPVKAGDKTLATFDTGTELEALQVQGAWVQVKPQVKGEKGDWVYGWVEADKYLQALPPLPAAVKEPHGEPPKPEKREVREEGTAKAIPSIDRVVAGFGPGPAPPGAVFQVGVFRFSRQYEGLEILWEGIVVSKDQVRILEREGHRYAVSFKNCTRPPVILIPGARVVVRGKLASGGSWISNVRSGAIEYSLNLENGATARPSEAR